MSEKTSDKPAAKPAVAEEAPEQGLALGGDVLDLDEWLDLEDVRYKEVPVPGGKLILGSLSAGDLLEWAEAEDHVAKRTAGLRLLAKAICNKDKKRVGTDAHVSKLMKKDSKTCNQLVEEVLLMNGLKVKQQDAAKNGSSEANSAASPTVLH